MDTMVTARMSEEKKRSGNKIIAAAGKTPSGLINELYDFVIDENKLPDFTRSQERIQDDEARKELFGEFIAGSALPVPASFWESADGSPLSDDDLLLSALEEKHGPLH